MIPPKAQWVRFSDALLVSQSGAYILSRMGQDWYVVWKSATGPELIGARPAGSLLEAKQRVNRHLFSRPLGVA